MPNFTPEERSCISAKIKKLRDEGVEGDEATARAIKRCAPGKSRASKSNANSDEGLGYAMSGYESVQNEDGTWDIKDVEIFAEHTRGDWVFDQTWLEAAVAKAKARQVEGYLPPLHTQHHDRDEKVGPAGHFIPKSVEKRVYDGEEKFVVIADLTKVSNDIYNKINAGEYPYRSVEILDVEKPEFDSLALLNHEVPYFRFRNLKPKVVVDTGQYSGTKVTGLPVKMVYRAIKNNGAAIMLEFSTKGIDYTKHGSHNESVPLEGAMKLKSMIDKINGVLEPLIAEMEGSDEVVTDGPAELTAGKPQATFTAPGVTGTSEDVQDSGEILAQYAALQGEIAGLRKRIDDKEQKTNLEKTIAKAEKDLLSYGIGDEGRKELHEIAKTSGIKGVESYVAGVLKYGTPDPPEGFDEKHSETGVGLPPELSDFSNHSPDDQKVVANAFAQYQASPDTYRRMFTAKQFIDAQLKFRQE